MRIITNLRLLLIAMWFGAALFFSAIVAPGAFAVLRNYHLFNASEIAGAVVNRNLAAVNFSGFSISMVLLLTAFLHSWKHSWRSFVLEMISLLVMAGATGVGQWVIAAKLHALRLTLNAPIDQIHTSDPRRISFDSLHAYSVKALGIAMIAALVGFVIIAYRSRVEVK